MNPTQAQVIRVHSNYRAHNPHPWPIKGRIVSLYFLPDHVVEIEIHALLWLDLRQIAPNPWIPKYQRAAANDPTFPPEDGSLP